MSKKTREQKIKNAKVRVQQKETVPETTSAPHHFTFTSSAPLRSNKALAHVHDATYTYLRKDILKTVVLAVIAIGALLALSFVLK